MALVWVSLDHLLHSILKRPTDAPKLWEVLLLFIKHILLMLVERDDIIEELEVLHDGKLHDDDTNGVDVELDLLLSGE